jgi:Na+-transporting NADH:ubiquinone oxidoreductase subunit NqrD
VNQRLKSHFFWGGYSPLSAMTGCALLVIASSRLAFAVFCMGAILWCYTVSAFVYFFTKDFMPARGKPVVLIFLSGFICSVYLFLTGLLNPLIVLGCWFFVILIPPCLIDSRILTQLENEDPVEALLRVGLEALNLGLIIIAVSLIREPLGFGSLSLPGGKGGFFELFSSEGEGFFPVRLLSVSSGGLLLLGYIAAVYRYFQEANQGLPNQKFDNQHGDYQ